MGGLVRIREGRGGYEGLALKRKRKKGKRKRRRKAGRGGWEKGGG